MNSSLRYGFDLDREYFIDVMMKYQHYMPMFCFLCFHPVIEYLLIFENKSMRREIRVLYILTHLSLILTEWTFWYGLRLYPVNPYAAFYCEGPLCRSGLDKQFIVTLYAIPTLLLTSAFISLMARMHQMFLPIESKYKLSLRTNASRNVQTLFSKQIILATLLNFLLLTIGAEFFYFGKECDDSERLLRNPELEWLTKRGGTIIIFGPFGDAQYFKWAILISGIVILILVPFLFFFTAHSMMIIKQTSPTLSSTTQKMAQRMFRVFLVQGSGATICNLLPTFLMLSTMLVDVAFIPGWILAPSRFIFLFIYTLNGPQFCLFFIVKNPAHKKILFDGLKRAFVCKSNSKYADVKSPTTQTKFSVSSRHDKSRF